MGMIKKCIKIELKSDLCVGSGFSYAGIIDSDVTFDKNGIPYIAGRRIKGCLKENAMLLPMIDEKDIMDMFGKSDDDENHGIIVGNAYPKGYDEELWSLVKEEKKIAKHLNEENTLKLFTSVRGQTSLDENGVAKKDTLRFTRVINSYDLDGNPAQFITDITFDETKEEKLRMILSATRHIGLNRNRGLGNVKISFIEGIPASRAVAIKDLSMEGKSDYCRIHYSLRNVQPLILSQEKNSVSVDKIYGTTILGALASIYLKQEGHTAEDTFFKKVFLGKSAIFSNLTITDVEDDGEKKTYQALMPVPLYINRLKKTKKLVNMMSENATCRDERSEYYPLNGNQPKKLPNYYYMMNGGHITSMKEVQKEIIYHHSKNGKNKEDTKGILYFQEAISAGQVFTGDIIIENAYKKQMLELLADNDLYLGKSRTAQYGKCKIAGDVIVENYNSVCSTNLKAGEKFIVTLNSDGIFMNDEGEQKSSPNDIQKLVIQALKDKGLLAKEIPDAKAFIQLKVVQGFHAKWNRRKNDILAVAAGSAFLFSAETDISSYPIYIGEKNQEGFGWIQISKQSDASYAVEQPKKTDKTSDMELEALKMYPYMKRIYIQNLLTELSARIRQKAFDDINLNNNKMRISASGLGRITLMLKESMEEHSLAYDSMLSLNNRINSIKSEEKREEVKHFLSNLLDLECILEEQKHIRQSVGLISNYIDGKDAKTPEIQELYELMKKSEADRLVYNLLPKCLLEMLTLSKYKIEK